MAFLELNLSPNVEEMIDQARRFQSEQANYILFPVEKTNGGHVKVEDFAQSLGYCGEQRFTVEVCDDRITRFRALMSRTKAIRSVLFEVRSTLLLWVELLMSILST